jgi:hypothetical protein
MGTVRYRLRVGDALAYRLYHYTHNPLIPLMVLAFLFNALILLLYGRQKTPGFYACFVPFLYVTVISPIRIMLRYWQRRKAPDATIQWTPNHVIASDADALARSEVRWEAILKAAITGRHVFLYISPRRAWSPRTAWVIPKRAFPDEREWQSFVLASRVGVLRGRTRQREPQHAEHRSRA